MRRLLTSVLFLAPSLVSQEEWYDDGKYRPRFEVQFALAGGQFEHHTEGSNLRDDSDGGLFRFRFEGLTSKNVGGGFRFEAIGSDDDLFVEQGFAASEARSWTGYGHFTYRVEMGRFQMPARIGILYNYYKLSEVVSDVDITYSSVGPYFELAPEIFVFDRRNFAWSFYGEFGGGFAVTWIDIANNPDHFYSSTLMTGFEAGTQFRAGPVQFGFAFCGRWQWMAESETENGFVVLGYDSEFTGFLISGSAVF